MFFSFLGQVHIKPVNIKKGKVNNNNLDECSSSIPYHISYLCKQEADLSKVMTDGTPSGSECGRLLHLYLKSSVRPETKPQTFQTGPAAFPVASSLEA